MKMSSSHCNTQNLDSHVKLDVGGIVFKTSKTTLTKYDNMLSGMFSGRIPLVKDKDGAIFIDRNGKHFGKILDYLRDGTVPLPANSMELEELRAEANYYCIAGLLSLCDEAISFTSISIKFNVRGTVFTIAKSTIMEKDHMLSSMLSGEIPVVKDETGSIFIDRNNKHFGKILDHLTYGKIPLPDNIQELVEMKIEADYYRMKALAKMCKEALRFFTQFGGEFDRRMHCSKCCNRADMDDWDSYEEKKNKALNWPIV